MRIALFSALLWFSLLSTTSAQVIPCIGGPCLRPYRASTHFIAEVNGGGTLTGSGGLDIGGVLGVGGTFRGFPLRFYLIGELAYSEMSKREASLREDLSFRDLSIGLRIYVSIYGPLQLSLDGMGGGSYVTSAREDGIRSWSRLGTVATGLQLRVLHHLSTGVRAKLSYTDCGFINHQSTWRPAITAGLTWHF